MRYFILLFVLCASIIYSQVPQTLSYQGVLTNENGVIVPDNTYPVTFKIYDVSTGGTALWTEMQPVTVTKGLFSTALGYYSQLNLPFNKPYWVGITVGGGTELIPRIPLSSSPYSFMSINIMDNAVTNQKIQDGSVTQTKLAPGLSIPPGGNAGGDLSGTFPNPVVGKLLGRTLSTTAPSNGQALVWNGTQWVPTTLNTGMGGSGTAGFIPRFTGANTIDNSTITEKSGVVNIPNLTAGSSSYGNSTIGIYSAPNSWGSLHFFDTDPGYSGSVSYNHQLDYLEFYTRNSMEAKSNMRILSEGQVIVGSGLTPFANFNVFSHDRRALYATTDSLSGLTRAIYGAVLGTGNFDATGVYGTANLNPGYGVGAEFIGGYRGITSTAAGGTYSSTATSVYGISTGTAGMRIGVYGTATGTGSTHFGVYGEASGAGSYAVYAFGNLGYTGSLIGPSDMKLKKNVTQMNGAIEKIKMLEPKSFEYTQDPVYADMNMPAGTHYGLIAQDIEAVFPQLVNDVSLPTSEQINNKTDGDPINFKGVNYIELIPVLIQGMKEQQAVIEQLQRRIEELEGR